MAINMINDPSLRTAFRAIYRSIPYLHNIQDKVVGRLMPSLKRTLRSQGLTIVQLHGRPHCLRINECLVLYVISTDDDMVSASQNLRQIIKSEEVVDSGYVLQLSPCPLWKRVQVSQKWKVIPKETSAPSS